MECIVQNDEKYRRMNESSYLTRDRRATNFARPKFRDRIPPQLPADSSNERNCRTRPRTS